MRIDQLMAGVAVGDATSNASFLIRDHLRAMGYASDIYAPSMHVMPAISSECQPIEKYAPRPTDIALHHFGLWSAATDIFIRTQARKVLIYHNITPGHFFKGYNDATAVFLDQSRKRLPELLNKCDASWADSSYNAMELKQLTNRPIHVFPLPFQGTSLTTPPDLDVLSRLRAPLYTWLSVGRMAPNKRLEELIRAFTIYRRTYNPFSRLLLVGSDRSAPRYVTYLKWLAHELNEPNICFEGFVWPEALTSYYRLADVYVSASDHEGYCLPLVEAMGHELPVLAKKCGGTPEAMGGAGILYEKLDAGQLARLVHEIQRDPVLVTHVLTSQKKRMETELNRDLANELKELLAAPELTVTES